MAEERICELETMTIQNKTKVMEKKKKTQNSEELWKGIEAIIT